MVNVPTSAPASDVQAERMKVVAASYELSRLTIATINARKFAERSSLGLE
jgi:hypothetical protein